ncbi:MAG: ribonuclease HI [Deferribacteres bacterium]|nr:ribonuclease HI [candidate division KSB1 bacterium]MCB9511054.1 ribonuclease HI [Deferribacteres bacterium]
MSDNKKHVEIYTDGACSGNPGPGGWGAILVHGDHEKEIAGFAKETTNNRMELTAVVEALQSLKAACKVDIYSDSAYLVDCFQKGWMAKWKTNGWRTANKKPVLNIDLWKVIDALVNKHDVRFYKVLGHSGHEYNERADRLAVAQTELAKMA